MEAHFMDIPQGELYAHHIKRSQPFRMDEYHYHHHFELYYLASGACNYLIGEGLYRIGRGSLILIPPGVVHATYCDRQPCHERYLVNASHAVFDGALPADARAALLALFSAHVQVVPVEYQARVVEALRRITAEYSGALPLREAALRLQFLELLLLLARLRGDEHTARATVTEAAGGAAVRVNHAIAYMNEHYAEPLTMAQVASSCGVSSCYFCRIFSQAAGLPFSQYLSHIRIRQAQKLLCRTELSITEVAERAGFSSSVYFAKLFRAACDVTPRGFRRLYAGRGDSADADAASAGVACGSLAAEAEEEGHG